MDCVTSDKFGPLLVYDRKFRHIHLSDEQKIQKALLKLVLVLRSAGLDDITGILQYLLRTDLKVLETASNIFIPRIVEYIQPRFHTESFRNFQFLGGGGFGTVFKAKHKIDGQSYAIKVVSGIRSLTDLERVSSEVSIMARLKHENVIQYVTSWVEYGCDPLTDEMNEIHHRLTGFDSSSSSLDSQHLPMKPFSGGSTATSDAKELSAVTSSSQRRSSPTFSLCIGSSSSSPDTSQIGINDDGLPNGQGEQEQYSRPNLQLAAVQPKSRFRQHQQKRSRRLFVPRLFIQMELCKYNLAQWLQCRNERLANQSHCSDWLQTVPHSPARWLADQLACGVAYLHANDMMHRDLKPENVLISGPPLSDLSDQPCFCQPSYQTVLSDQNVMTTDQSSTSQCYHRLTVKICDFGLARILNRQHNLGLPALPPTTNGFPNSLRKQHTSNSSFGPVDQKSRSCSSLRYSTSSDSKRRTRSHGSSPAACHIPEVSSISPAVAVVVSNHHQSPQIPSGSCTNNVSTSPYLLTGHLGSELYAAPEVRPAANYKRRLLYDHKADVYSMGVIFLQLFYPFSTLHELITCLQSITGPGPTAPTNVNNKNRRTKLSRQPPSEHTATPSNSSPLQTVLEKAFPRSFVLSWPEESQIVGRMLSSEPSQRPTAVELMSLLSSTSELPRLVQQHSVTPPIMTSPRPASAPVASVRQASSWENENHNSSVSPWQQLRCSNGGAHRILDWLLWRNRQLERELAQVREQLEHCQQQLNGCRHSPQP